MLRGAIDYTSPKRIGGWIYSELAPTRDTTVLAFLDGQCVGAGAVTLFRQDLADAGLGDGHLGFNFDINVSEPNDVSRVVVKLDGSDLVLIQPCSRIESPLSQRRQLRSLPQERIKIEWMRARGWLEQSEFDFLKFLAEFGVYDLSLRRTKAAEKLGGKPLLGAVETAQAMLSLLAFEEIELVDREAVGFAVLTELRNVAPTDSTVVALFSVRPTAIHVLEGSNNDTGTDKNVDLTGAVEYKVGPDRLLFLDLRTRFEMRPPATEIALQIFSRHITQP